MPEAKRAARRKRGLRCPQCGAPLYVRETIPLYSGEKIVRVYERCACGVEGITSTEVIDGAEARPC